MSKQGDSTDIFEAVWTNEAFRREVLTGTLQQVVVMTLQPGDEIGEDAGPD